MKENEFSNIENLRVMADAKKYNDFLLKVILKYLSLNKKILDFGTGTGRFSIPLREKGFNVFGVEIDNQLRKDLLDKGFVVKKEIKEFGEQKFDFIFSFNVLEHIQDDFLAIKDIFSQLECSGFFIIFVPAFNILFSSMDKKVGHYRRYRKRAFQQLLQKCGFDVLKISYVDPLGFFATLLYRCFDKKDGKVPRLGLKLYDNFFFPISRILGFGTGYFFGKNLLVICKKPFGQSS